MKLFVCIVVTHGLLPHFLSHYTRVGVHEFHIAVPPQLADQTLLLDSADNSVAFYTGFDVDEMPMALGTAAVSAMRDVGPGGR